MVSGRHNVHAICSTHQTKLGASQRKEPLGVMIRRKVAERLQARRRASSGSSASGSGRQISSSLPSSSTPDATFSTSKASPRTVRQNTEGFLFVDDRDALSDSADDMEDHEALQQAVADDLSGFEISGALDGDEFDSQGESSSGSAVLVDHSPLLSGARGRVRSGALSIGNEEEALGVVNGEEEKVNSKPSKPDALKPWKMTSDKEVYEQQLELMQEQLMTAMVEKEELKSELTWHGRKK